MSILLAGFFLGLSLVAAIGPQNAFVIRQGIKREYVGLVVLISTLSDIAIVFAGTAGVGVIIDRAPIFLEVLKWAGIVYLLWFAYTCFRDAMKKEEGVVTIEQQMPTTPSAPLHEVQAAPSQVTTATRQKGKLGQTVRKPRVKIALTALAFTWLNPGAYVDAVVMLGGIANQYGPDGRWVFAFGVLLSSVLFFPLIGYGSAKFSHVLARPAVWRVINVAIGLIMVMMVLRLLMH